MKKVLFSLLLLTAFLLGGCSSASPPAQIAATTLPVYEFTSRICQDTPLTVTRLVTEQVSCLHDYSLNVRQVKAAEAAELIVISGAGLEEFLDDILQGKTLDASRGIALIEPEDSGHSHTHNHDEEEAGHEEETVCEDESHDHSHEEETVCEDDTHDHSHEEASGSLSFLPGHDHEGHHHDQDPHIWLSPANAMIMAENICHGLSDAYPQYRETFQRNLQPLLEELQQLDDYGRESLQTLSCRELITFHDGFAYLAQSYNLTILDAIEEESGSEASAKELIHMIEEVRYHNLPALFTEKSGSVSAAGIISRETGAGVFTLDMAMAGDSYFDAMYRNIDTLKEALK